MDCIFCKIAKGEIDSAKIWENEDVMAFLDASPDTKGHCLVVPKKHFEDIFDIDREILKKIIVAVQDISVKIKESLGALGVNIASNNKGISGQIVPHFHMHIIPRYEGDGLVMYGPRPEKIKKESLEDLRNIAAQIK